MEFARRSVASKFGPTSSAPSTAATVGQRDLEHNFHWRSLLMNIVETRGPRASRLMPDSRWLSLIVLCTGFLLIVVDATIVNVALPSIQRDLGFSQADLAWVVNGYLIAFGGLLLLAGRLGDLVGRKRIFLIGLATFTAASVLCGLS